MKFFVFLTICGLGGGLLWAHARRSKHKKFWREGNYMQQIASLAPTKDEALPLPAVVTRKGERESDNKFRLLKRA